MATVEDVLWIYERNSYIYSVCQETKKGQQCKNGYDESGNTECYCHLKSVVMPISIGYQWTSCQMKRKSHIKIGEECPICIEPIIYKADALLTYCGHSFHRRCIHEMNESNTLNNNWNFICPLCRTHQGHYDNLTRYNHLSKNGLDRLEDFWINFRYQQHTICECLQPRDNKRHYIGMNKSCYDCRMYRENGNKY